MAQTVQAHLHYALARELFQAFPNLSDDISARPAHETALQFLDLLRRSPTPEDALTYAAYLLPRRQSIWWGYQCVNQLGALLGEQDIAMLALTRDWVAQSEEPQRLRALEAGMAARNKTPGVWICLAAGWSGGSLAPPDAPRVPPSPVMTPRAVNVAVHGALARVPVADRSRMLNGFVDGCLAMVAR